MDDKYLMKEIEMVFRNSDIVDCYKRPFREAIVKLANGDVYSYRDGYTRRLPSDPRDMTPEQVTKEFGRRLRYILDFKFMTQEDLSIKTGISRPIISNYINGKTCPSFVVVDKIARALNCSMDDFRL